MCFKTYFLGFAFLFISVRANVEKCAWERNELCPTGKQLMFTEIENDLEQAFCCPKGHQDVEWYEKNAKQCRNSVCNEKDLDDLCSTLPTRIVKGVEVEYQEELRESCSLPKGGRGYTALCCDPSTPEGELVSTLGADSNEFPFIAKLNTPGHCAATIYDKRHIITAAHCVVKNGTVGPVSKMTVRLGTNFGSSEDATRKYKVEKVIPHPQYSRLAGQPEFKKPISRTFNDIAVLKLDRDIVFEEGKIQPIPIAPPNFQPSKFANKTLIIGWGTTDTLKVSEHLQKANFVLRNDDVCFHPYEKRGGGKTGKYNRFTSTNYKNTEPVPDAAKQLICVGGVAEGVWSPTAGGGDSGGPAICRDENGYGVLCGITSFGGNDTLCLKEKDEDNCPPSVYADVSYFRDWIIKNTGRQQENKGLFKAQLYGEKVPQVQYPHQVHITSSDGKKCGGTLVKKDTVITAAQCVATGKRVLRPNLKITAGIIDSKQNGKAKTFRVKNNGTEVEWCDGWKRVGKSVEKMDQGNRIVRIDDFYHNDIVVIKLDGAVDIPEDKLPSLPKCECEGIPQTGTELSFPLDSTDVKSGLMMKREFRLLKQSVCRSRLSGLKNIGLTLKLDDSLICGIEKFSGGSTCDRELGGGLICKGKDGRDTLCGVQVFRLCESTIPNGFANMAHYTQSIRL